MSLNIIWGPTFTQDKTTKKWNIRAKYQTDEKIKEFRKRGIDSKKEAKLIWLDFYGQFESIDLNKVDVNIPSVEQFELIKVKDSRNAIQPWFNQNSQKHIGLTINELYELYKNYITQRLKSGSVRSACDVIRKFVLPTFGDLDAGEITTNDILDWQNFLNSTKYKYKYKSKIYCGFTALMNYGIKFHNLSENVVSKVGNFKNNEQRREMLIWSEDEFQKVYSVINDQLYQCLIAFLYLMGTREGEALALTWRDVDFIREEVKINKSINRKRAEKGYKAEIMGFENLSAMGWHNVCGRKYEITTPKNKASYRQIVLPKNLVNILKEYKVICEQEYDFAENNFVFGGKFPLSSQTVRRRLNEYADKAGVKRIRVHDLRHSHASLLINKGQNILIVSQRLGHSDITQTLNTYSHLFPNVQKQIIDAIDLEL